MSTSKMTTTTVLPTGDRWPAATKCLRLLELYCGIGGVAAAIGDQAEIAAAIDIHLEALAAYRQNFCHPAHARTIEGLSAADLKEFAADLWWLSPPCQPFTRRGKRRDLDDPRAHSLKIVMQRIAEVRPPYVALENVPGFAGSRAHAQLSAQLASSGYQVRERLLCPTELGIPNRRQRFYLLAARGPLRPWAAPPVRGQALADYLLPLAGDESLYLAADFVDRYRGAIHIVDATDPNAQAHCFTSAYGRSHVRSGSYLAVGQRVRRFHPREILALLGFPHDYRWPDELKLRKSWALVGNSLSVPAVRWVLSAIPFFARHRPL